MPTVMDPTRTEEVQQMLLQYVRAVGSVRTAQSAVAQIRVRRTVGLAAFKDLRARGVLVRRADGWTHLAPKHRAQ